ncbi:MAG: YesL family protein [Lachnospiraceae bacterium]
MSGIFDINNPFFRFMGKLVDLFFLNIVFILTCVPAFLAFYFYLQTNMKVFILLACICFCLIGTSITSLFYVCMRMIRNEEGYVVSNFFSAYKQNFKKTTIVWICFVLAIALLGFDFLFWRTRTTFIFKAMKLFTGVAIFVVVMVAQYTFPLMARFENTIRNTVKNAFILALSHIFKTIFLLFIAAIILLAAYLVPILRLLFVLIGVSGIVYTQSTIFNDLFQKLETNTDKVPVADAVTTEE